MNSGGNNNDPGGLVTSGCLTLFLTLGQVLLNKIRRIVLTVTINVSDNVVINYPNEQLIRAVRINGLFRTHYLNAA